MAPKKQNGFMLFVFEWKEKHGRNMNLAQATSAAGEIWKKMTIKQREPYLKRALAAPVPKCSQKKVKLTCDGTPIELIEKERIEKEKMVETMLKNIEKTIKMAVNVDRLEHEKFYFIIINYFTRLLNSDVYVPAEIAIIEFSLMDGVSRKYHMLVNPDIQLYGNVYEAQNHADTTHNLPLPPNAMGESDMRKISSDIFEFILDKKNAGLYPPLYTHNNAMGYVSSALAYIAEDAESEDNDLRSLDIYSIQELFYALKCATCDLASIVKPRNRFVSDTVLERDAFEYANNIACNYHEELDRSNYCALSQVNRWAFSFADYMGKDLAIKFISGSHMPGTVNASIVMKEPKRCIDDRYLNGACSAMSSVSLDTTYYSCSDNDQARRTAPKPIKTKPSSRAHEPNIDFIYSESESNYNPWKRHDDSKPPDSRFFSLDYEANDDKSTLSTSRRVVRGRGIVILDE